MDNVIVTIDSDTLSFPHGTYKLGANLYQVNSMGIFKTNNFQTVKLFGGNTHHSSNDKLVVDIELRGLHRTIT